MLTFQIEGKFPDEHEWHTIWSAPENRSTIEELVRTLNLYRKNNPDLLYRLIKIEIIG